MATPDEDDDRRCQLVTEVAMEQAVEECGEEAARAQLRRMVGVPPQDEEPECEAVLASGLDEETLSSTRRVRRWVMCQAWEYVSEESMTLSKATEKAWAEVNAAEEEYGVEV